MRLHSASPLWVDFVYFILYYCQSLFCSALRTLPLHCFPGRFYPTRENSFAYFQARIAVLHGCQWLGFGVPLYFLAG